MLAEMVKERTGGDLKNLADDGWHRIHSPLLEFEELQMTETTPSAIVRPGGFVRMAYTDEVDGSTQFCRAYLPAEYDPSRTWPVVLFLHGYNPPNPPYVRWWSVDDRHNPIAEYHGAIYLEPHGRGNAQYLGIGERDVLRCVEEARKRFSVDSDRIYLTGESMGGSGTWIIASRHPDIFAAAAPFYGGWDYRIIPGSPAGGNPRADSPPERFAQEVQSSFLSAENLLNVPLFVRHGDADQAVSVEFSRHAVKMLQRWGYDIRYQELPGWGHEDLNMREDIADWLLAHRRVTAPRHVRIRTQDLSAASVNWVSVEGREDPFELINVDAEVIQPGLVRLDTRNVTRITLSPPEELRGKGDTLRLDWNGTTHSLGLSAKGEVRLDVRSEKGAPLAKRPGLDGGLSRIMTTPFAVVVGTCSPDPLMRRRCAEKAEAFASLWASWQHCRPRVLRDNEITEAEEHQYSLILIGGADANLVTRRLDLPLRIARDSITIDGRSLSAVDAVVQMIYPSPFNGERYIEVVAGTSASGLYFWNPLHWDPNFGFPTLSWDWIIRDGRRTKLESGMGAHRGWVASGVFDRNWKRDDRWVFPGSEALRAGSPLRHAPAPGFEPGGKALDACVGSYEVFPGNYATVARVGNGLIVRVPYGPTLELVAENDTEFVVKDRGTSVAFSRDPEGKVDGVTVNDDGQEMSAKKVR